MQVHDAAALHDTTKLCNVPPGMLVMFLEPVMASANIGITCEQEPSLDDDHTRFRVFNPVLGKAMHFNGSVRVRVQENAAIVLNYVQRA